MPYQYWGSLSRVVDGDTVDAVLDLGFHMSSVLRFRLLGADSPERHEAGWAECTVFTTGWFTTYGRVIFTTQKTDSFGRWLADVNTADGEHNLAKELNELMASHGWTSPAVR